LKKYTCRTASSSVQKWQSYFKTSNTLKTYEASRYPKTKGEISCIAQDFRIYSLGGQVTKNRKVNMLELRKPYGIGLLSSSNQKPLKSLIPRVFMLH